MWGGGWRGIVCGIISRPCCHASDDCGVTHQSSTSHIDQKYVYNVDMDTFFTVAYMFSASTVFFAV